jgi:hypothetical protein
LTEENIMLPTLFDTKGELKKVFGVSDLPRHFLINPDGKIVWEATGAFKWNEPSTRDQLLKITEEQSPDPEGAEEVPEPDSAE